MEAVIPGLETEVFSAEREWTVDGIPVLTARVALPEPVGAETRLKRRIRRYYRTGSATAIAVAERSYALIPVEVEIWSTETVKAVSWLSVFSPTIGGKSRLCARSSER